jgi:hypothetical protein
VVIRHREVVSHEIFEEPDCNGRGGREENVSATKVNCPFLLRILTKLALAVAYVEGVSRVMFDATRCNARRETDKFCFGHNSEMLFVTGRFWPNLHWLCYMWRECNVWCLHHPAAVGGKIGTKNFFGHFSKLHFFTARLPQNLHSLWLIWGTVTCDISVAQLQGLGT